jgi:hypothetical protein
MYTMRLLVEIKNATYDEWKIFFDERASIRAYFSNNVIVSKVDDHTAIVVLKAFDPEGLMASFNSNKAKQAAKTLRIVKTPFKPQPMD